MSHIEDLFQALWTDYAEVAPLAPKVVSFLRERGETIVNDHIALRTFAHSKVDIEVLDRAFVSEGYEAIDSYEFPEKKLTACHYEHPVANMPKVFISALLIDECSTELQEIVSNLIAQVPNGTQADWRFPVSGRPWSVDHATYLRLLEESQYAAWLAAFGFRANHFTVAVHKLKSVDSLEALNELLMAEGFSLNEGGGLIKGSPAQGLEQSSTMADKVEVEFSDGKFMVPSCYYEFAYRHKMENGELFQGFIAGSATHLFDSTNT